MNLNRENIPFVEKYRPTHFDDIVLDPTNKIILKNVIETGYFPNLLFFGPPGTGKTTTIINLINSYQETYYKKNKDLVIHLNASDDRGIEIIRTHINSFVSSKNLFTKGMKFVILDEVDYMTKNAQQALKYLIQNYSKDVRFCLICNYISKIDESLQNDFLRLRFNQLPEDDIKIFLKTIIVSEKLNISEKSIHLIQQLYKSDIRSMINFIQANQNINDNEIKIISNDVWENIIQIVTDKNKIIQKKNASNKRNKNSLLFTKYIISLEQVYNIDKKNIIKDFSNYIVRTYPQIISHKFLNTLENIIHFEECDNNYYINYYFYKVIDYLLQI
jgi:DNA polymerase III delta prime subunit